MESNKNRYLNSSYQNDHNSYEGEKLINRDEQSKNLDGKFTPFLIFCVLTSVVGASFQFGWNLGVFNTPENVIKDFYKSVYRDRYKAEMSDSEMTVLWSITNGLMPLGGIVGGLSSGFVADHFGRKNSLLYTNLLVIVAGVLNLLSKWTEMYETIMIGRLITGLFCGLFTGILPIYLYEIAPKNLRGLTGTLNQLNIVLGILTTNIIGLPSLLGTSTLWPLLVGFVFVPMLFHLALSFGVQSPKYLFLKKNDRVGAEEALIKLRGIDNLSLVQNEIEQLDNEKISQANQEMFKWADFLKKKYLFRPLVVTLVIQMSQQFSGINAVIFYSTSIFRNAGFKDQWPVYCTIMLGFVQVIMTFVCVVIVDKVGRKILLLVGMMGMCVSAFGLATFSILANKYTEDSYLNYLTVFFSIFYIVFFAIGPGAIPWIITSELFGSAARGKAVSLATLVNWLSNFIVTVSFPFIQDALGSYSFILFGIFLVFFSLFMMFFVPETKNKSTDEIEKLFRRQFIFF